MLDTEEIISTLSFITLCNNRECTLKGSCNRFSLKEESTHRTRSLKQDSEGTCEYYWKIS